MRHEIRSRVGRALVALALLAPAAGACGSRGPLDDAPGASGDVDAGDLDAASEIEAGPGDSGTLDARADGPRPPDSGPPRDAGPLECGLCVAQQCSSGIVACIQNPACTEVFNCVINDCLLGGGDGGFPGGGGGGLGGLNASCLFTCGASNFAGALQVLGVFQCITGTCGPECGGILGGLGGGGGGGGFPGIPGFPGGGGAMPMTPAQQKVAVKTMFSAWPELSSRVP